MFAPEAAANAAPALPSIPSDGVWLPHAGSTLAADIDYGWWAAFTVATIVFFTVLIPMVIFVFKYKRKTENDKTEELDHSTKMEIAWSVIPLIVVFGLFFIGLKGYVNASIAPRGAYEIKVLAQKWSWTFMYPNGVIKGGELVVPKGRPVKLILSSQDVLHSFYVPEFRVKNDAIPGQYTTVWFEATRVGETLLQCTEYCGKDHSDMLARVRVMEEPDFNKWLETEGTPQGPPEEIGKKLYAERGCVGCHTLDGTVNPGGGPSFKGLYGKSEPLTDGSSAQVDDEYLRESILNPGAKIVKGFPAGVMPAFQGQLSDIQINGLIAFIKAQK